MPKIVVHQFVGFLAGVLLTVSFINGMNQTLGRWDFGAVERLKIQASSSILSATSLSFAVLVASSLALVLLNWRRTIALSGRIQNWASFSVSRSAAALKPRLFRSPDDVSAIREELEQQLSGLIILIASQLENSKDYVVSLKDTSAQLVSVTSAAQFRELIRSLISKSERNERHARDLAARLEEAQNQAAALGQRLKQAETLASLDPLTQVANRRQFEQFILSEVELSHSEGTPLCLVMADIDHFKSVNDNYGHSMGDEVLKAFAALLVRNVRSTDLVARFGGEEFAIVLPRTPMGNAYEIAERVRSSFQSADWNAYSPTPAVGKLTASFGIAEVRDGEGPTSLIGRADKKLYEAKSTGRNRTSIWATGEQLKGPE